MNEEPLILAVDDEKDYLEIVSVYLESVGFRTATLEPTDTDNFLRLCGELRPALALIDIYVATEPVGITLANALKSNPETANIKIILWSSAQPPSEMPADDFFNKGEDLKLLVEKIRLHMPASTD